MASYNNLRPIQVLLVEDSPTDLLMTREALERSKVLLQLHVVEDGVKTMEFLRQTGKYAAAPRPDLILLDLNLPKKDGREVLSEVKADPRLKVIPVIVLTTSKAEEDVAVAYRSHANCYITKPVGFANFNEMMRSIERYWFSVATLPP
ncbi:MAG TPA: response regulator [Planctomycetota bacterium]